jgi:CRISPR/Cas system CSM-associated protein Csm3 (group 7 of RAMP superfamily)
MTEKRRSLHRSIIERIVITSTLELVTPAHFGNGDAEGMTDMVLIRDETSGMPLLTGTSIGGALRSYLRERELGYEVPFPAQEENELGATLLFGGTREDPDGEQSPLIVYEAEATTQATILRDGVGINPITRTAADDKKFDYELLPSGTKFNLRFELLVSKEDKQTERYIQRHQKRLSALVTALMALGEGEITLGMRKRRGFGRCHVKEWNVTRYELNTKEGLISWLAEGREWSVPVLPRNSASIVEALGGNIELLKDKRRLFSLSATFTLEGSLLIRSSFVPSESGSEEKQDTNEVSKAGPDAVHLNSPYLDEQGRLNWKPVLPGTSLGGIFRSHAYRIAGIASGGKYASAKEIINKLFGPEEISSKDETVHASRIEIDETVIEDAVPLVQDRIAIDRFTGGALEGALFEEQPIWSGDKTRLRINLRIRNASEAEVGLLLLLLKDLWSADLRLGGETGIGRGRLSGIEADIAYDETLWHLQRGNAGQVDVSGGYRSSLQGYVDALNNHFKPGK